MSLPGIEDVGVVTKKIAGPFARSHLRFFCYLFTQTVHDASLGIGGQNVVRHTHTLGLRVHLVGHDCHLIVGPSYFLEPVHKCKHQL